LTVAATKSRSCWQTWASFDVKNGIGSSAPTTPPERFTSSVRRPCGMALAATPGAAASARARSQAIRRAAPRRCAASRCSPARAK